jgi:hypothetical protein
MWMLLKPLHWNADSSIRCKLEFDSNGTNVSDMQLENRDSLDLIKPAVDLPKYRIKDRPAISSINISWTWNLIYQARMKLNWETNSQMLNLTWNELHLAVISPSNHFLAMQILQFVAMSSLIELWQMYVICNRKSKICTQLQLMQECECFSNRSLEVQILQFVAISSLIQM